MRDTFGADTLPDSDPEGAQWEADRSADEAEQFHDEHGCDYPALDEAIAEVSKWQDLLTPSAAKR